VGAHHAEGMGVACHVCVPHCAHTHECISLGGASLIFEWRSHPPFGSGVALVSRIDKMIGLFCKRALQKSQYSAKETYNFIDPTNRSHPIVDL